MDLQLVPAGLPPLRQHTCRCLVSTLCLLLQALILDELHLQVVASHLLGRKRSQPLQHRLANVSMCNVLQGQVNMTHWFAVIWWKPGEIALSVKDHMSRLAWYACGFSTSCEL